VEAKTASYVDEPDPERSAGFGSDAEVFREEMVFPLPHSANPKGFPNVASPRFGAISFPIFKRFAQGRSAAFNPSQFAQTSDKRSRNGTFGIHHQKRRKRAMTEIREIYPPGRRR
jgi:hypothetical protein